MISGLQISNKFLNRTCGGWLALAGTNIGITYLHACYIEPSSRGVFEKKIIHLAELVLGGVVMHHLFPSIPKSGIVQMTGGIWFGYFLIHQIINKPDASAKNTNDISLNNNVKLANVSKSIHSCLFGNSRVIPSISDQCFCVGAILTLTGDVSEGFDKTYLNLFMLMDLKNASLFHENGEMAKKVRNSIFSGLFPTHNQAMFQTGIRTYLNSNEVSPKLLVLLLPWRVPANHCACVVIEFNQMSKEVSVTLLDSIPSWSWEEHTKVILEELREAGWSVKKGDEGKEIMQNAWTQDNQMKCGLHLMMNVEDALNFKEKSLYDWVKAKNADQSGPDQFFKKKTHSELLDRFDKLKGSAINYLKRIEPKYQELLFFEAASPYFSGPKNGSLKNLIDYCTQKSTS